MDKKILDKSIDPTDGSIVLTCKRYREYDLPDQTKIMPNEHKCRVDYDECPLYIIFNKMNTECDGILKLDWVSRLIHPETIDLLLKVEEK